MDLNVFKITIIFVLFLGHWLYIAVLVRVEVSFIVLRHWTQPTLKSSEAIVVQLHSLVTTFWTQFQDAFGQSFQLDEFCTQILHLLSLSKVIIVFDLLYHYLRLLLFFHLTNFFVKLKHALFEFLGVLFGLMIILLVLLRLILQVTHLGSHKLDLRLK